jgi:hypothetical protein
VIKSYFAYMRMVIRNEHRICRCFNMSQAPNGNIGNNIAPELCLCFVCLLRFLGNLVNLKIPYLQRYPEPENHKVFFVSHTRKNLLQDQELGITDNENGFCSSINRKASLILAVLRKSFAQQLLSYNNNEQLTN